MNPPHLCFFVIIPFEKDLVLNFKQEAQGPHRSSDSKFDGNYLAGSEDDGFPIVAPSTSGSHGF
jgi:hypothetical protein